MQVGLSEAAVLLQEDQLVRRPAAVRAVARGGALVAQHAAAGARADVHRRRRNGENGKAQPANGLVGLLVSLMVAEKSGFAMADTAGDANAPRAFADRMTEQVMQSLEEESKQLSTIASRSGNGEGRPTNGEGRK